MAVAQAGQIVPGVLQPKTQNLWADMVNSLDSQEDADSEFHNYLSPGVQLAEHFREMMDPRRLDTSCLSQWTVMINKATNLQT